MDLSFPHLESPLLTGTLTVSIGGGAIIQDEIATVFGVGLKKCGILQFPVVRRAKLNYL